MNADEILLTALESLRIDLAALVAMTGIWAAPQGVAYIRKEHPDAAVFPNVRRYKRGLGERRSEIRDGVRLDDNSYANHAAKLVMGLAKGGAKGFAVCHVWPETCYDVRYHTSVANLVLLPRALEALSDHDPHVIRCLQYRSYDLFKWHPAEVQRPTRPAGYPTIWRPAQEWSDLIVKKLRGRRSRVDA